MENSSKISLQLPIIRALAIMTTVGLGFVNLYYDAKEGSETYLRWGIAIAQFLIIGLLLFQSDPRLLGVAFGLALLCTAVVWPRFKSHESVRLPYIITQAIAAGLIGYMLLAKYWKVKKNREYSDLLQFTAADEQKIKNIQDTETELKKQRNKLWQKKNRTDEEQKAFDSLNIQLKNNRDQQDSFRKQANKRRDSLDAKEAERSKERQAIIADALGSDFSDEGIELSTNEIEGSLMADSLAADKGKVIVL